MTSPVVWTLALPLLAAGVAAATPHRLRPVIGVAGSVATLAAAAAVAGQVWTGGVLRVRLVEAGGLAVDAYADGVGALLLGTTCAVNAVMAVYAAGHYAGRADPATAAEGGRFWPRFLVLASAMNGVFLLANVFALYVTFEVVGVGAVALVVLGGGRDGLVAGIRYLVVAFGGSIVYLVGAVAVYADSGVLDLYRMADTVEPTPMAAGGLALMTVGLLVTAALFPLHFWLPSAHALAPAPASPILSALVIKVYFYAIVVLWFQALPQLVTPAATRLLAALAIGAIAWGGLAALRQRKLKRLVAYSTVSQMGYLFLIPVMLVHTGPEPDPQAAAWYAWNGGVYYAIAHSWAKAAMLMAAGALARAAGDDDLDRLHGAARSAPLSTFAFALAGINLVGLPPTGGFVGKWYLLTASLASGQWWIAAVVLGGGGLTAAYLLKVLRRAFAAPREGRAGASAPADAAAGTGAEAVAGFVPVPRTVGLTTLLLALVTVALGFRAVEVIDLLEIGAPFLAGVGR